MNHTASHRRVLLLVSIILPALWALLAANLFFQPLVFPFTIPNYNLYGPISASARHLS